MAEKVKGKTVLAEVVLRKRNARTFDEKQTSRLISEWIKYPCLYEKCNKLIKTTTTAIRETLLSSKLHQPSMNLLTYVKKTPLHVCTPDSITVGKFKI